MSTVKATSKVELPAPGAATEPLPLPEPRRRRITRPEEVEVYERMLGKKFVRKDGTSNGDYLTPTGLHPEFVMEADSMSETSAFVARFNVERRSNNGESEQAVPTLVFGREVRVKAPCRSFFQDCAAFAEQHEEKRD